jgi:energy-coupling factor transporter ATP-binding protein EcfA2
MNECTERYIRPCLDFFHTAKEKLHTLLNDCTLVENVFKMIVSVCAAGDLLVAAGAVRLWEASVHRIAILSCIWTFGVCSPCSRDCFQDWFCSHFASFMGVGGAIESESSSQSVSFTASKNQDGTFTDPIFPMFERGVCSLFDNALVYSDESEVYLSWEVFDFSCLVNDLDSDSFFPTMKGGGNTSEERMRKSYRDIYYTNLIHQNNDLSSLLVPTATANAFMLLQAALMKSGATVLVAGSSGSGKTSLMRQLMELSKVVSNVKITSDSAARWVCHVSDCGPKELQAHIQQCKQSVLPMLMERKLLDKGAIVIDDMSLVNRAMNHTTAAELLRATSEAREMYFIDKKHWRSIHRFYMLLGSRNEQTSQYNMRLARHMIHLYCDEKELERVFAYKALRFCSAIQPEVAHDLSVVTLRFVSEFRSIIFQQYSGDSRSAGIIESLKSLTASEHLFVTALAVRSASSVVDFILSSVVCSLESMGGNYSSNDVVRVWDRVAADFTIRYPIFYSISDAAHEIASNECVFQLPSFSNYLEKEKLLREQGLESIMGQLSNLSTAPLERPLSYTKLASGFFELKNGVYAGVTSAEHVRDTILKKYGPDILPIGVSKNSLSFWTDVQTVASELSMDRLSGYFSVSLLLSSNPLMHQKVINVASLYVTSSATYHFIYLDPSVRSQFSKPLAPAKINLNWVSEKLNASSNKSPSVDHLESFQDLVTNAFMECFLLDADVLRCLKRFNEESSAAAASSTSVKRGSTSTTENFLGSKHLLKLKSTMDVHRFAIVQQAALKYNSLKFENSYETEKLNNTSMTVWHFVASKEFCEMPNSWEFLMQLIELRSPSVVALLSDIDPTLNPTIIRPIRTIIQRYLNRQKVFVSLDSSMNSIWATERQNKGALLSFEEMAVRKMFHDTPSLLSTSLSMVSLYDNYEIFDEDLLRLFGKKLSAKICSAVDRYSAHCKERLLTLDLAVHASSVSSAAYRNGTFEAIITLFDAINGFSKIPSQPVKQQRVLIESRWCQILLQYAHLFAVNLHATSDLFFDPGYTFAELDETESLGVSENMDIYQNIDPLFVTNLADALINILFCRYASIVPDEGNGSAHSTNSLLSLLVELNLPCTLMVCNPKLAPLTIIASAASLCHLQDVAHTNIVGEAEEKVDANLPYEAADESPTAASDQSTRKLRELLLVAASLPSSNSYLRDFLCSIALLLVTNQRIAIVDCTFESIFFLLDLLNTPWDSLVKDTLSFNGYDITVRLSLNCFKRDAKHLKFQYWVNEVNNKTDNLACSLERLKGFTPAPLTELHVPLIIAVHSKFNAELFLAYSLKHNVMFDLAPTLRQCWRQILFLHNTFLLSKTEIDANKLVLNFEVEKYEMDWISSVGNLQRVISTVSALFCSLTKLPSFSGLSVYAAWTELMSLVNLTCSQLQREFKNIACEGLLSVAVESFLHWLQQLVSPSEFSSVLMDVVLNIVLDTSHSAGRIMAQRVLMTFKAAVNERVGVIMVEKFSANDDENGDVLDDDSSTSSASTGSSATNNGVVDNAVHAGRLATLGSDDESENSENEDYLENIFCLSDVTIQFLKQSLVVVAQSLASSTRHNSVEARFSIHNASTNLGNSLTTTGTSSNIVNSIKKNIEIW